MSQAHDLTHVGVGVSQVLPIMVMCLLADPDTTMVFEQPELHLHPKVQTLLGDFFLSMAILGKQCILETHSEYLINRLRFRAAADVKNELAKAMRMYFVEKIGDTSNFRPVVVNEFGAIPDWPDGFFDQSLGRSREEFSVQRLESVRIASEGLYELSATIDTAVFAPPPFGATAEDVYCFVTTLQEWRDAMN